MRKDGIIKHGDLVHIWAKYRGSDFTSLAENFIRLLEKLGMCFLVEQDRDKPFLEQRSIIPALLPDRTIQDGKRDNEAIAGGNRNFHSCWSRDPPFNRAIEIERSLLFNVIPMELISRLLVQLHPLFRRVWFGRTRRCSICVTRTRKRGCASQSPITPSSARPTPSRRW